MEGSRRALAGGLFRHGAGVGMDSRRVCIAYESVRGQHGRIGQCPNLHVAAGAGGAGLRCRQ